MQVLTTSQEMPKQPWAMAALVKFPQFYCWAWYHMVWNIALARLDQLSCFFCFSASYAYPVTVRAARKTDKSLALCNHCSETIEISVRYQHYSHSKTKTECLWKKLTLSQPITWQQPALWFVILMLKQTNARQERDEFYYTNPVLI